MTKTKPQHAKPCVKCSRKFPRKELVKRTLSDLYLCKRCNVKHPEHGICITCDKTFPADQLEKNDDGMVFCEQHYPNRKRTKEVSDLFGWFVLSVEPGTEGRVKKAILRKLRIEDKKHLVKRIIIAKRFEELVVGKKGVLVAEGRENGRMDAVRVAQAKTAELEDSAPGHKYRYVTFRSQGEEEGREGNDFSWQVKTVPQEKERRTLQVKKWPGYLICQMEYCAEIKRIIEITRGAWDLLLKPVVVGHLIEVKFSKRKGGWVWKVRTPDKKTIVARGGPHADKGTARGAAETAKDKIEEFKPTPLKTREAAELLISQKTVNAIARNPEERDKAILNFRVGSTVKLVHGQFKETITKVEKIDREDKVNVKVWITVPILGHPIPVEVLYWHLEVVSY